MRSIQNKCMSLRWKHLVNIMLWPIAWAEITLFQTKSHQISVKLWQKYYCWKKNDLRTVFVSKHFNLCQFQNREKVCYGPTKEYCYYSWERCDGVPNCPYSDVADESMCEMFCKSMKHYRFCKDVRQLTSNQDQLKWQFTSEIHLFIYRANYLNQQMRI